MNPLSILKKTYRNILLKRYEPFPELLSIELTTACNSSCIMCPRPHMKRKIGHMDDAVFRKVIADCRGRSVKKINFFWFGDPFCNPKTIDYLRFARKELPGVKFYVSTNAGLLTPEKTEAILSERLLDVINFDIDGVKKETYEAIRVGVNFDVVQKNVRHFIARRKELGLSKPQIRVTMIKMEQTKDEVQPFLKTWKPLADKVDINNYNTWMGTVEDRNTGAELQKSRTGFWRYPCIHLWNELVISSDGTAGLCCLDFNLTVPLGNVAKETITDIWRGEKLSGYRNSLIALDYNSVPCCKHCNGYLYYDRSKWAWAWRK